MASTVINIYQAKAAFSQLVDRVEKGEEIVIAKAGKPLVKLVPLRAAHSKRKPGGWEGQVFVSDDFDDALPPEIAEAFE